MCITYSQHSFQHFQHKFTHSFFKETTELVNVSIHFHPMGVYLLFLQTLSCFNAGFGLYIPDSNSTVVLHTLSVKVYNIAIQLFDCKDAHY